MSSRAASPAHTCEGHTLDPNPIYGTLVNLEDVADLHLEDDDYIDDSVVEVLKKRKRRVGHSGQTKNPELNLR